MSSLRLKKPLNCLVVLLVCLLISACGGNKKNISINLQSDPLGAYALMQVKYKGKEDSDWIFLGPTPIVVDKQLVMAGATSVSLKVIRPGFYEQVKSWKAKDFMKELKQQKEIVWVPNMVQQ
ncbi:MAG: hypothetical protein HKN85_07855 [Gammaproteobacteria bacterium]|nr:hypothetical protein [Gammaproteobacteria bacterium]